MSEDKVVFFRKGDAVTPARFWEVFGVHEDSDDYRQAKAEGIPEVTLSETEKKRLPLYMVLPWGHVGDRYFPVRS